MRRFYGAAALAMAVSFAPAAQAATFDLEVLLQTENTRSLFSSTDPLVRSALGIQPDGTILVSQRETDTATGTFTDSLLGLQGGGLETIAVFDSDGPKGLGTGTGLRSVRAMAGSDLLLSLQHPGGPRTIQVLDAAGTLSLVADDLFTAGGNEHRLVGPAVTAGANIVAGTFQRAPGGTGNSFTGSSIVALDASGTGTVLAGNGTAIAGVTGIAVNRPNVSLYATNSLGHVVFDATLQGSGVDLSTDSSSGFPTANTNGLLISRDGSLSFVVSGGEAAPDGLGVFSQFLRAPAMDDTGRVLFGARTYDAATDTFQTALFLFDNGTVTVVAKAGDPVPGGPAGAVIEGTSPGFFRVLNDGTLFYVVSDTDGVLYLVRERGGVAEVVMATGDTLDLGGGLTDTVLGFDFTQELITAADRFVLNVMGATSIDIDALTRTQSRYIVSASPADTVVPLPASLVLMLGGLGALGVLTRRRA